MSARRRLALLATEAAVAGVALAATWTRGVGAVYHRVLAGLLDAAYPRVDPLDSVLAVRARGAEMLFRVVVGGARRVVSVQATDVTLGMVLTLTLFVATHPVTRRRLRRWLGALATAVGIVTLVHAGTFVAFTQELLRAARGADVSRDAAFAAIVRYDVFFENGGGVLLAVAVWLPWGLRWVRDVTAADTRRRD